MPNFPSSLIPTGRTFTAGTYPHTALRVLSGRELRIRHSNAPVGNRLRVAFTLLTTDEMLSILSHYEAQLGGFLPFAIPDDLLTGVNTPANFTPSGHRWIYASSPTVEDVSVDVGTPLNRHNVEIELVSVPPENAIVAGVRWRVRAVWTPGALITAGIPLQFLVTATWRPGMAAAGAPGMTATATSTWAPGKVSPIPLARLTATATWAPGDASDQLAYRYIRMNGFANTTLQNNTLDVTEIQFFDRAGNLLTGITSTPNFTWTGWGPDSWLTDGVTTDWTKRLFYSSWSGIQSTARIDFDLGSAKRIGSIKVFAVVYVGPTVVRFPASFQLSGSNTAGSGFSTPITVTVGDPTTWGNVGYQVNASAQVTARP